MIYIIIFCFVQEILKALEEFGDQVEDKANFYYLKGWLLNIRYNYNKEVFDSLSRSIKLKPNFAEAWVELGECYRKKDELKLALNCFETALKNSPHEVKALRNASIMLRSLPCLGEEKKGNILRSIELAKKALETDLNDGNNWAVLANAYLTLLFMTNRMEHNTLVRSCKSAYQKALLDSKVNTKADVLFNYASILQHEEEFEEMLKCLAKAFLYDPEWRQLDERKDQLIAFFSDICQKMADASSLKPKRLNSMIEKVKCDEEKLRSRYADSPDMCNGNLSQLQQLEEGENDCLLVCRVLSYTTDSRNVFLCSVFHVIDSSGHNIALFIYDIVQNKGPRSGDSLVIIRPFLKRHHIEFDGKRYEFDAIKVVNPLQTLFVNNRRIGVDSLSIPVVNVTLKSD